MTPSTELLEARFRDAYGTLDGVRWVRIPYPLALLGGGTDREDGLVLGAGVGAYVVVLVRRTESGAVRVVESLDGPFTAKDATSDPSFSALGALLQNLPVEDRGMDLLIHHELPMTGVARDAAVGAAVARAVSWLDGIRPVRFDAWPAWRSNRGLPRGLLGIAAHGRPDALVFVDPRADRPRSQRINRRLEPFDLVLLTADLPAPSPITPWPGSEGKTTLRDLTLEGLRRQRGAEDLPYDPALADHVLNEIKRVKLALRAITAADLPSFGRLITASGESRERCLPRGSSGIAPLLGRMRALEGVLGVTFASPDDDRILVALLRRSAATEIVPESLGLDHAVTVTHVAINGSEEVTP